LVNLVFTAGLLVIFKPGYKQGALGIANTVSALFNAALLAYALRRKLKHLGWQELRAAMNPLIAAGIAAALVAWFGLRQWELYLGHDGLPARSGAVFGPALLAALVYWGIALWLKVPAAGEMLRVVTGRFGRKR
jgi:peptidoglycan biosynthesis protein MviN/MurJ (putative lipid II flippase)